MRVSDEFTESLRAPPKGRPVHLACCLIFQLSKRFKNSAQVGNYLICFAGKKSEYSVYNI